MRGNHVNAKYLGSGDPALRFTDYYPKWLDNLADDVTLEGSLMDGTVQGPEPVRTILFAIRSLYDRQDINFAGPAGDSSFLEDYTTQVHGESLGCIVFVTRNANGQTQHVSVGYRPRSGLLLLSRLLGEKFAGTLYGNYFATRNHETDTPITVSTQQFNNTLIED